MPERAYPLTVIDLARLAEEGAFDGRDPIQIRRAVEEYDRRRVSLREAAEAAGLSREAVYYRVRRAQRSGREHPFRYVRIGDTIELIADRDAALNWLRGR